MISRRGALIAGGTGAAVVAGGAGAAYPAARLAPKDEGELAAILKVAQAPIRPVGAGHSFTALAPTDGTLVSLDAMAGIVGWEGDAATVRAGTRLGALGPLLAEKGRAL